MKGDGDESRTIILDRPNDTEPYLIVRKAQRKLELYESGKLTKIYDIVLGSSPTGHKEIEGDGRTPEGDHYIFTKNDMSKFHLSLGLSYPHLADAERGLNSAIISSEQADEISRAVAAGAMPPQKTALGGEIYIHGGGTASDWTDGCVALNDDAMSELFDKVSVGTNVRILP